MGKLQNGILTESQKQSLTFLRDKKLIASSLNFLKKSNGLRPGELSIVVGPKGNGKSALAKTMGFSAILTGVKTLYVLSEEKAELYKDAISKAVHKAATKNPDQFLENVYFDPMLDWKEKDQSLDFFFNRLENHINDYKTDLVIFDNFTTSFLGELHVAQQAKAIRTLRSLAAYYEIAIVCFLHTKKGTDIYSQLISSEDVKGTSTSTDGGSYVYILTTYFQFDPPVALLFVDKARYHDEVNKTYWFLGYDRETGLYDRDVQTDHATIIEMLKNHKNINTGKKGVAYAKSKSDWRENVYD